MRSVESDVVQWLNSVVIGLNLCPFSKKPMRDGLVCFVVSVAHSEEGLLEELVDEMSLLDDAPANEIETTLLIVPNLLQDFFDYTQFLQWANSRIKRQGWRGVYQVASFHPNYCFAGAEYDDVENLTNRSPHPILHIIREASLVSALTYVDDVAAIPERNKQCMRDLNSADKKTLFPYLFKGDVDDQ